MKKVSLVVIDKDRVDSLKKLRKTGLVHLEKKKVSSLALSTLFEKKAIIDKALNILRNQETAAKAAAKAKTKAMVKQKGRLSSLNPDSGKAVDVHSLALHILDLEGERKSLKNKAAAFSREKARVEGWGSFNPGDLLLLKESGLVLTLYVFSVEKFKALPPDIPYIVNYRDKKTVRVVLLGSKVQGHKLFTPGEHSLDELNALIADSRARIAEIDEQLIALVPRKAEIGREQKNLFRHIEFENAYTGMGRLDKENPEYSVSWISGFIPSEDLGLLKRVAAENSWALLAVDPAPDDMVPTKLKHNRIVSLLNPLTEFLEITPGYREADISPWFLFFFVVFFGMIFGDAAYGAIILIAAMIGIIKNLEKGVPRLFRLLLLLGISNFIWGVLTCTWFGVDASLLPDFLQRISLPAISNAIAVKSTMDEGIVRQNLMIFCFTLALLQMSIGHIIAMGRCRTLKLLGDLGAIAMLLGMYGLVLSLIASNEYRQIPFLPPCVYLLGGGFVVNFVFVNFEGSVAKAVQTSFKNFISMFLGVANVFGDIMSYIRLWAVGLAGGAIASTVNQLAGPMLGHFIFFVFGILLVVFGHGLNLVLNALSVLVHGVRLNTLEFSSHAGLGWAGTPYKPFSEKT